MVVHETYKGPDGWVTPAEVKVEDFDGTRKAFLLSDGTPIEIGSIEKMSKSKKNVVDPDDIIGSYGADTARWFMLSDSPPERDVIWTEAGVEGAHRFVQRLWRLVSEAAPALAGVAPKAISDGEAAGISKAAHKTVKAVGEDIDRLGFNKAVARIYELTNVLQSPLADIAAGKASAEVKAGAARGARHAGRADRADDAASGRGVLRSARRHRSRRRPAAGRPSTRRSSSTARSSCRSRSTARSAAI